MVFSSSICPSLARVPLAARLPVLTMLIGLSRGTDRLGNMRKAAAGIPRQPAPFDS